jgi:hypothetical protein
MEWISRETAALLYARERVAWEAGEQTFRMLGGWSRFTGLRSFLDINSIVAATGVAHSEFWDHCTPTLCNQALFRRDGYMCMYCGTKLSGRMLTRDHVLPLSRGGRDEWENVVSSCKPCNTRKGNMTPTTAESRGISLLAVPYRPNLAEGLVLQNRKILADQMQFLKALVGKGSRLVA